MGMSSEWREYKLSDIIEIIGGGTPKRKVDSYWNGDIPWLSVADFNSGDRFVTQTSEYITTEGLNNSSTKLLKTGQIIISARGTVGCLAQLEKPMAFNQSCYGINGKNEIVINDFLYYLLKHKVSSLKRITHGAVFDTITRETFDHLQVCIPSIANQKKISKTLGDLDKKIQINRQINQTLEEMAQAIFKSWFVDFDPVKAKMAVLENSGTQEEATLAAMSVISGKTTEALAQLDSEKYQELKATAELFPSAMQDSELGEIPKGWEITKTEDIAEKIGMGPFGSNIKVSTFVDTGVPVISGQHLKTPFLEDKEYNFITESHAEKLKNSAVFRNDIVFTHAGSIGQVSLIPNEAKYEKYAISQRQFFLRANPQKASPHFLLNFFRSRYGQHILLSNASQVGVPSIARPSSHLKNIEFINPGMPLMNLFEKQSKNLTSLTVLNRTELNQLIQIRDALLPELLSGSLLIEN